MHLTLNGITYAFIPIKDFRAAHDLPPDFGVALFEVKDYSGMGRIESAGSSLNSVRTAVLEAIPVQLSLSQWRSFLPELTHLFESQLHTINDQVGLSMGEIDFAAGGFSDALQTYAYALIRAQQSGAVLPAFPAVYADWLNSRARVFAHEYPYLLDGQVCRVQVVAHAYGRVGLLLCTAESVYALYDPALACPAEGFMAALLGEVAGRMVRQ
jgi:hypothetical protein